MTVTPTLYSSAVAYRAYFDGGSSTGDDASIEADMEAVCRHIDSVTGRFFGKDSTGVARVFIPPVDCTTLRVDDMAEKPSIVKIDSTRDGTYDETLSTAGFEAWPLNVDLDPEPRPFYQVHLPPWASRTAFPAGHRVQVTTAWGFPDVPQGIAQAAIQLTGILRMQSPRATNRFDELGTVISASREGRDIVRRLIQDYALERYA